MARWTVYKGDLTPSCTQCGMAAPFARYRRKNGVDAHYITDYCPSCGHKITAIDECEGCKYSRTVTDANGKTHAEWQDNGICFSCRGDVWTPGKKQNERVLRDD